MNDPISVTIKNNGDSRFIRWLEKGAMWANKGEEITVPYEPYSCADRVSRSNMLAELGIGRVELTLHILTASGIVDVKYDPSLCRRPVLKALQTPVKQEAKPAQAESRLVIAPDNDAHTIIAASGAVEDIGAGFTATSVKPPVADRKADPATGFSVDNINATGNHVIIAGGELPEAVSVADQAQDQEAREEEPGQPVDELDVDALERDFDALCAEKKWAEARRLLVDAYGADAITFSAKNIASLKTFAAVRAKYAL